MSPTTNTAFKPQQPKVIQFYTKTHFGRTDRYLSSSPLAFAYKTLTGRSTLRDEDMKALKVFGFSFQETQADGRI
mgnify:CR=1 FL=1